MMTMMKSYTETLDINFYKLVQVNRASSWVLQHNVRSLWQIVSFSESAPFLPSVV